MFEWRQSNCNHEAINYIDINQYGSPVRPSHVQKIVSVEDIFWIEIGMVRLKESQKNILIGRQWLTSDILNAAQQLLAAQFNLVCGLQDTEHGVLCTFITPKRDFIQILHDGVGHSSASSTIKQQIATLSSTPKESIELRFIDVQKQSGTNDCRLYAIAYAIALCFGKSPSGLVFDQSLMRKHLRNCFEQSNMTMFPALKTR